jgi:hypothetical protein
MTKHIIKTFFLLFFLSISLFFENQLCPAQSGDGPIIHIAETKHVFPTVFEGSELTYTFVVSNRGTATLNIKRLTHS